MLISGGHRLPQPRFQGKDLVCQVAELRLQVAELRLQVAELRLQACSTLDSWAWEALTAGKPAREQARGPAAPR